MNVRLLLFVLVALNILVWGGLMAFEAWVPTTASATSTISVNSAGGHTLP